MVLGGSFVDEYFKKQIEYENKYGENTVVLIQKGSFYEIYGVYNDEENIGKAKEIARILNITLTCANKSIEKCDRRNPNMTGIPQHTLKKYLKILNDHNYTIVVINQTDSDNTIREVSQIYSPGTYDDESIDSVNICGIYYTDDFDIYICSIDISIGNCKVYEIIHNDNHSKLEDLYRTIHSIIPKETVLFSCKNQTYEDKIKSTLNVFTTVVDVQKASLDENYVNSLFAKVYGNNLVGIENIVNLSNKSKISVSLLLNYIYEHNETILDIIQIPTYDDCNNLLIYNNGIHQLNIINPQGNNVNKSLFDVLCRCNTHMGKRLFKKNMTSPFSNCGHLQEIYNKIENMIKSKKLDFYNEKLKHINDIERGFLKIKNGKILKQDFKELLISCNFMYDVLYEYFCNEDCHELNALKDFNIYMNNNIDIYEQNNFFRNGVYQELDSAKNDIDSNLKWIYTFVQKMSKYINTKNSNDPIKYDHKNNYIHTTPTRGTLLSKCKFNQKDIELYGDIKYKSDKTKCIISSNKLDTKLHDLYKKEQIYDELENMLYLSFCECTYVKYKDLILLMCQHVANIDVIVNNAILAIDYNYCKPVVVDNEYSFINATNMRHGLIELLDNKTEYIPNDVLINPNESIKGILLYGVNGSGKSCYSKSIGIAIIMAQMGMYVPCSSFTYSPYKKIFTRINCDDNLFKGQSSFFVEMSELRSILNYIDGKSIVLGDEICKGTESVSALGIVGATLHNLLEKNVSFVFATHLHKLTELSVLKNVRGLCVKHIQVEFDKSKSFLKYTRKLSDGHCDSVYGLEIADYILENPEFFKIAYNIRNEIIAKPKLLSTKKSKYNTNIFVDSCEICKSTSNLDVHHIEHQSTINAQKGKKTHKTKNDKSNLVTLCKVCHNDHHKGKLEIKGWMQSSNGVILDYVKT